jgi:uncharacterized protein (TIGR02145 family)
MKNYLLILLFTSIAISCADQKLMDEATQRPINPFTIDQVQIGTQIWKAKNLNVTKYNDGTLIPQVTDPIEWSFLSTGAWCYYNNTTANSTTYGRLYNWYAVAGIYDAASAADPTLRKKLAPPGWHIPSDAEWITLVNFLGGQNVAGSKMKTTGTTQAGTGLWLAPNTGATNTSGFSGLPGGYRYSSGSFDFVNITGVWWSSSGATSAGSWVRFIKYNTEVATRGWDNHKFGYSVRCIKN